MDINVKSFIIFILLLIFIIPQVFTSELIRERENNQISDSSFFGKLSSAMFPELTGDNKRYEEASDDYVRTKVFPPSTSGNDGSVYGQYY
jgi:hypothetical protein